MLWWENKAPEANLQMGNSAKVAIQWDMDGWELPLDCKSKSTLPKMTAISQEIQIISAAPAGSHEENNTL